VLVAVAVGLSITGVIAAAVELSISDAICCSGDDERVLVMLSISDAIAAAVGMSISDASAAAASVGARSAEHFGRDLLRQWSWAFWMLSARRCCPAR